VNASFSMKRHVLLAMLDKVAAVLPSRDSVPILRNYQVDVLEGGLKIAATDTFLTLLSNTVLVDVQSPGSLVLPGKAFGLCVKEAIGESVTVEARDDCVMVTSGAAEWQFPRLNEDEYPPLPDVSSLEFIQLDRLAFLTALSKVYPAASLDTSRPSLCVVDCNEGRMRASDGVRCAQVVLGDDLPLDIQIPSEAVGDLMRLLKSVDVDEIGAAVSSSHIAFTVGFDVFIAGKMMLPFPDIDAMLIEPSAANDKILACDREELISAVRRVRILASPESAAMSITCSPDGRLVLESRDEFGGRASEEISCEWEHDTYSAAVNHNYLYDLLSSVDAATCRFYFGVDTKTRKSSILHRDEVTKSLAILSQMRADWL